MSAGLGGGLWEKMHMGSADVSETNSTSPAAATKSSVPSGANSSVFILAASQELRAPKASATVAQVGLVCALALMTLCLTILAAGALDGRPYSSNGASASPDAPGPASLETLAHR
jgi:hypothetical protein